MPDTVKNKKPVATIAVDQQQTVTNAGTEVTEQDVTDMSDEDRALEERVRNL